MNMHNSSIRTLSLLSILLLSAGMQTACHLSAESSDIMFSAIHELERNTSIRNILVIPRSGCGGCIDAATVYLERNKPDFDSTIIIFTLIQSKKDLHIAFGDYLHNDCVIVDTASKFYNFQDSLSIYPMLYSRDEHVWSKKVFKVEDTLTLH